MAINSRQKGARGEREFAKLCREHGFNSAHRGQQFSGVEGEDVKGLPNIHIECKRVEKLNLQSAMEQAVRDSAGVKIPIVAHKKNNCDWMITMRAEEWFGMYKESELSNE